jgi:hypothetical protein
MAAKIVAIVGTYRKGKVIDTAVSEVLRGAEARGATTEKIYLIDKHIEFCTNCRTCTQEKDSGRRGTCVHNDAMEEILAAIDEADGVVLGAPTNFSNVNALTRRFMERLLVYAYWPWGAKIPTLRVKKPDKAAVTVTASACPAFLAKVIMPGPRKALKIAAEAMGAKVRTALYYGAVAQGPGGTLSEKDLHKARRAGVRLAGAVRQMP